jgi:hypothetical protein
LTAPVGAGGLAINGLQGQVCLAGQEASAEKVAQVLCFSGFHDLQKTGVNASFTQSGWNQKSANLQFCKYRKT